MPALAWTEWIGWLTAGTSGFVAYWSVLIGVAMLEVTLPGRQSQTPLGPRLVVNLTFGLAAAAVFALPFLAVAAFAMLAADQGWGLLHQLTLPLWFEVLATFLAFDLIGYAFHRLSHQWHPLWRLHRVHHSDNDIDLSTIFRSHPASLLIYAALYFPLIFILGLHPLGIMAHGFGKVLTMSFGHANIAAFPRFSAIIGTVFVTTAFHIRHHSASRPETDSNYGEVLTIWDRLFGTASRTSGTVQRFGLGDRYDHDSASLKGQLFLPFVSR